MLLVRGFQTNPRGVEARTTASCRSGCWSFQTNPRGVEALFLTPLPRGLAGFRRTLVGLKPGEDPPGVDQRHASFRRTLVGLKRLIDDIVPVHDLRFQTNPRGVEARNRRSPGLWSRSFQTNPRGVEATLALKTIVSECVFQTNPRGVEAPSSRGV